MISVVVPIYNGEKFIEKLYMSLSKQTYQDFEMIFVNDGSKDNSLEILNIFANKDKRVRVVSQPNAGICSARNKGIEYSQGEYLVFLDQDDGFENDLLENYYNSITKNTCDLAVFGKIHYYIENGKCLRKQNRSFDFEVVTEKNKIYEYMFNVDNKNRISTIWNCIYKREIILNNNIKFDTYFKHGDEDGMFNFEYLTYCKTIMFSDKSYYHYYIRKNQSTITKKNDNLINDYLYYIHKTNLLTKNIDDNYINGIRQLYCMRFFSNVYRRYCRFNNNLNDKMEMLEKIVCNKDFFDCLTYSTKATFGYYKLKYLYWDIWGKLAIQNKYHTCINFLDFMMKIKELKER